MDITPEGNRSYAIYSNGECGKQIMQGCIWIQKECAVNDSMLGDKNELMHN
jgi:hypothetical protein